MTSRIGIVLLSALLLCFASSQVWAQGYLIRIEEDWELCVQTPDERLDAPQITTTMLPFGSSSDLHFQLHLNHALVPDYASGGLQVAAFNGTECVDQQRMLDGIRLTEQSEHVSWTQVLIQDEQGIHFGVVSGTGSSWGPFGGATSFVHISASSGTLATYSAQESVANSGATYAGNRVETLRLKKVRYFLSTGDVVETTVNLDTN